MRPTTHLSSPFGAGCDLGQSFWDVSSARKMCCSVTPTGLVGRERGEEVKGGALRGAGCPAHQIRIGPVALQGRGDFANNQVVHLLGGLWIVSGDAKKHSPVTPHWSCLSFSLGAQSKGTQCLGLPGLPRGKTTESAHKTGT